jgi:hypothetical protein
MVPVDASIKRALGADNVTGADASGTVVSGLDVSGDGLPDSAGVSFSARTENCDAIGKKAGPRRDRLMKMERMVCIRIPPVCSITF